MSRVDLTLHMIPGSADRLREIREKEYEHYERERLRREEQNQAKLEPPRRKARKIPYEQRVRAKFAEKRERN